jgi:hypothetical protein
MSLPVSRRQFLAATMALGLSTISSRGAAEDDCRKIRGLVLLVDYPGTLRSVSKSQVIERFGRLSHYVDAMSYGKVCAEYEFTDWLDLPEPISAYAISPVNLEVDKSRVVKLIQHAIDAADASHDFSRYDYVVIYMGAQFREYGMVGLCGYPGMLGWRQELEFKTTRRGQVVPNGVAIFTSTAHLGTLFHDSAHVWGGVVDGRRRVPCLYDHDLQVQYPTIDKGWENALINMGYWDPMSCHSYHRHLPPPGISSWTKLRLGWMPAEKVKTVDPALPTEVLLGPLAEGSAETLVIRIPLTEKRYLLIENRQPIGVYDRVLPEHGVLIMKADDDVAECRFGKAPVKLVDANPERKHLLGAAFAIPGRDRYVDPEFNIEIRLLEKIGLSYRIRIGRPL